MYRLYPHAPKNRVNRVPSLLWIVPAKNETPAKTPYCGGIISDTLQLSSSARTKAQLARELTPVSI